MIFSFFRNTTGAVRAINQKYANAAYQDDPRGQDSLLGCSGFICYSWSESWSTGSSLCCTKSR